MRTRLRALLLATLLAAPGLAAAYCEGGRYPNISLDREVKDSEFVIVGTLMSYARVADPEDPEGYAGTHYRVRVDQLLRGRLPARVRRSGLTIYNVNTSARFPFDEPVRPGGGKSYLMLVRGSADGYWVDACGHSGEAGQRRAAIRAITRQRF